MRAFAWPGDDAVDFFKKGSFKGLILVYALWLTSTSLGASLFEVYFYNLGLSIPGIYLADSLWFLGSLLVIPLFRGFRARDFMLAGIAISFVSVGILLLDPSPSAAIPFRLLIGVTNLFFWAPFNILYYEFRKGDNAALGAVYYAIGPVLSLFTPAIAGFLAASIGFPILFALAMLSFALTFAATFLLIENKGYGYSFISCIRSISGLRSLIFMEGFAGMAITSITLNVMLLLFENHPAGFGLFTSLVTVFAVAASLVTARLSDRLKRRREFLLPLVALFSLASVFASQSHDVLSFFVGFGLVSFFSRIFYPLPLALVVDNSKSLVESMVGREIFLNLGRLCGGILGWLVLLRADISTVLLLQGLFLFAYVPIFENRKRKLSSH